MDFKKTYFDIWKAAWDFHKNYCNPSENSEYWDKVVDEAYKINAMYKKFFRKQICKRSCIGHSS